jgi:hypothetical protein
MSYLNAVRLHFAGQFQANVSTVNNDPGHFDNADFQPGFQQLQGVNMFPANGWFNPQGDATWRLLGCRVTSAWLPGGQVGAGDPVLACAIADADARAPAKLVDLDPEQQMVSEIWGLQVRIADGNGNTLLRGEYEPAAFIDIWNRATAGGGGDMTMGAMYQSVITALEWGDVSGSPFLTALQNASASSGKLSIKFNVDGINMDYTSPDFMCGRIVGTIGPAYPGEPDHFVAGRQFMTDTASQNLINYCVAVVDPVAPLIYLDLGNALPTTTPGGPIASLGDLQLSFAGTGAKSGQPTVLGTIPAGGANGYASDPDWYANTAGVVVLSFDAADATAVASSPLTLAGTQVSIGEWPSGAFVRADRFVWRVSPGDVLQIPVLATRFGQPLGGTTIHFAADPSQLQPSNGVDPNDVPPVGTPLAAIGFAEANTVLSATTGGDGWATLTLPPPAQGGAQPGLGDPGTPRWFNGGQDPGIDGQVYGVRPAFADAQYSASENPLNFVSILLWSGFAPKVPNAPTWYDDLQPIFRQYANLYPVMNRFLDLGDYDSVVANQRLLLLAFGLDNGNPNVMPVTRDLSPAKRAAILQWLQQSPPPLGTPPTRAKVAAVQHPAAAAAAPREVTVMPKGGKTAALARRLAVQNANKGETP